MNLRLQDAAVHRLQQIERARHAVLLERRPEADDGLDPGWGRGWIARSWRRCLDQGHRPQQRIAFDPVAPQALRRTQEANHELLRAARPVLAQLGRAIAHSHYFAILTDAHGVVIDTDGPVDARDRRAHLVSRIGVDLSERAIGTAAIGAALAEQQPIWLHRGEHFFDDTAVYSCAGAPVLGPDGRCVGVLDLTGVEAPERPELMHLAAQSARSIEAALVLAVPHALLLRLNWPGRTPGDDADGLVALDGDGMVVSANLAARQMLAHPLHGARTHCSELFAMPWEVLYDTARGDLAVEVPLWSGLTVQVLARDRDEAAPLRPPAAERRLPLKAIESELIRRTVQVARGNVAEAARMLGISRATVYRKLGMKARP